MINYILDVNGVYHASRKSIPAPISKQTNDKTKKIDWELDAEGFTLTRSLYSLKEDVLEFKVVGSVDSHAQFVQPDPSLQPHLELDPQQPLLYLFYSVEVEPLVLGTPSYLLSLS